MDDHELSVLIEAIMPTILERLRVEKPWKENILVPSMDAYRAGGGEKFMQYSSCSSRDFFHPEFKRLSQLIGVEEVFHRKHWEWIFIIYHAYQKHVVGPGKRGIVFGVGNEMLPSVFAKAGTTITATDAPFDIGVAQGWQATTQYAAGLASLPNGELDRAEFERLVEWRECDMNAIDPAFTEYDFCWSSCCLEHLGDLRKGFDFILNSVEKVLKVGGVAIHTTEFNLSSNSDTIDSGDTVLYRRRDFETFIDEVRARGHQIEPFRVAPDSLVIDGYVDTPPFSALPHLRLRLGGYAATSAGLVITRGR